MKFRFSSFIWGLSLLLAATFLLVYQLDGFKDIGIGSIIAAILALLFTVQCIAHLRFTLLPIPAAVLYAVFQAPLNLPEVGTWILICASVLASIGLSIMFPKNWYAHRKFKYHKKFAGGKNEKLTKSCDENNNPSVSVSFGAKSRRLQAGSLETALFNCNFGALEIFFDQVELSPNGAEVSVNCSFGVVELYIPKGWHIIDRLNCTMGEVGLDSRFFAPAGEAPQLTLTGTVSLGSIEVHHI